MASVLDDALRLPSGARFYRCALQVNPYEYLVRNNKAPGGFLDETSYNKAVVGALLAEGIEVIAVTDHYQVSTAESLRREAEAEGILAFPAFEAVTKDGVHFLCLFPRDRDLMQLERALGDCGVHDNKTASPTGKYDVEEFLVWVKERGAICIAAHVAGAGGLLAKLSGTTAINAWRSRHLLACSLPASAADAPSNLRPILENKNPDYGRERPVTILNAQDILSPSDVGKPGASCWIKMSEVTVEGLRQAFLDPTSRVRLASDPNPEEHVEFLAIAWEGGFLDGVGVHFNENLNVLIGGRGTGKSTIVESLRAVLGLPPLGAEAKKAHDGITKQVLRSGTKISLRVRSHHPSRREYVVERTLPNPPLVKDDTGAVLTLKPIDVVPHVEVYGQHEISELSKSPEQLTRLLERFVTRNPSLATKKTDIRKDLERSRGLLTQVATELGDAEERLAALPALEETFKRYRDAGLEERLADRSRLVTEEQLFTSTATRISAVSTGLGDLRKLLPIDTSALSTPNVRSLSAAAYLAELAEVLGELTLAADEATRTLETALEHARSRLEETKGRWDTERRRPAQVAYERILRELQKEKIDGEEFISIRRQIERLRPLREQVTALTGRRAELEGERRRSLADWEDAKAEEFRELERAARAINRQLANRVRVQVAFGAHREPLLQLFREHIGGRISEALSLLDSREPLSLQELATACRAGAPTLSQRFGIAAAQAERIVQGPQELFMQLEELELSASTRIELNVAAEGSPSAWQTLDDLSTGQKATAVLLLLLLESQAPLVVDQPEDDLDNRFITEGVVPKMKDGKRRRQFVFTTHNANIPVLGDAELIVGLTASGEAAEGKAVTSPLRMGSIDVERVREFVEEVLEGGKNAFEMRRLKYGF